MQFPLPERNKFSIFKAILSDFSSYYFPGGAYVVGFSYDSISSSGFIISHTECYDIFIFLAHHWTVIFPSN